MRLPRLPFGIQHAQPQIIRFLGLNLTPNTQEGEFSDMRGIQTSYYPCLRPRNQREQYTTYTNVQDVYAWDRHLYVVDDLGASGVKIKKDGVSIGSLTTGGKKLMAVINSKLVVYPDKLVVDLSAGTVSSLITTTETYASGSWSITISNDSGTNYVIINATGIGNAFKPGDAVELSATGLYAAHQIVQTPGAENADAILLLADGITMNSPSGALTARTPIPDLDFICSSGNRIWGVNNSDNTIYASALGDPSDFFRYGLGDIGPYAVTVGSGGPFTGICEYDNAVCVWKEKILHKVLGSFPSEFYMDDSTIDGVQEGSERSLVVINETLYYKGVNGVYQYAGGRPQSISYNLGTGIFTGGVGGTDGSKYYLNMTDPAGDAHLYTYDLKHGLWSIEGLEGEDAYTAMANLDNQLHMVYELVTPPAEDAPPGTEPTVTGKLRRLTGSGPLSTTSWYCEFVPFYEDMFNRKGYLRLLIRMDMTSGSTVAVKVKEDNRAWKTVWTQTAVNDVPVMIPLRLGRCDKFTLRIEGTGDVLIRTVGRDYVVGSVIN